MKLKFKVVGLQCSSHCFVLKSIQGSWRYMEEDLNKTNIQMKPILPDLVDRIWNSTNGRPEQPNTPINALPLRFAGINKLRTQ